MLVDREPEEGTAGDLPRHKIGHMGIQTVCIGEGELDAMGVDLRGGLAWLRKSSSNSELGARFQANLQRNLRSALYALIRSETLASCAHIHIEDTVINDDVGHV
jgi:hypothetical protein